MKKNKIITSHFPVYTSNAQELLKNINKLTVEDVIVMYAYSEAIVETVREPLVILDSNLRVKTANKAFFDTFNVTKNDTYNRLIFDLGNNQWNIPQLKKLLKEILPKSSYFNDFEVVHEFEDIGKRTMILNARRIILDGHHTQLILLAIEDITKRRAIENKLRESEQHYRSIIEQLKDYLIYSMDKNGYITDWNNVAEEITGYKKAEVLGKFHGFIFEPKAQKQNIPQEVLKTTARKGKAINERWHISKDGTRFWGSGLVLPLRDDEGEIQGYIKIMRDFTTRKEQDQRKDESLAIASHELKSPITSIKAYTSVLEKRLEAMQDTTNTNILKNIDAQATKLSALVNDFLDMSKIQTGKLVFTKKKFDLDTLIRKIVRDFQYVTATHEIKIIGKTKQTITGDQNRIGQVLINLLTNAHKFSSQGKEIIVRSKVNKDSVTVSVQDFGIGISQRKIDKVFDKYFQVNEKGNEAKKSLGLGLYIASQIIKNHNGKIWVESTKGKGSTFSFTLPLDNKR